MASQIEFKQVDPLAAMDRDGWIDIQEFTVEVGYHPTSTHMVARYGGGQNISPDGKRINREGCANVLAKSGRDGRFKFICDLGFCRGVRAWRVTTNLGSAELCERCVGTLRGERSYEKDQRWQCARFGMMYPETCGGSELSALASLPFIMEAYRIEAEYEGISHEEVANNLGHAMTMVAGLE